MKVAVVLGATGLVGSQLVNILLTENRYDCVRLLVRKPLKIDHHTCVEYIIEFEKLNQYGELFSEADVFCCLGTTIKKAKTKEAFRKVDFEYPVEAGKLAKQFHANKFLIVSALGAKSSSKIFYSKVKGETEEALKNLNLPALHIFRPSLLIGKRDEFRLGESLMGKLSPLLNKMMIGKLRVFRSIKARDVAKAMVITASNEEKGEFYYLSHQIKEIADFKTVH